jgi:hypothetical protein
MSITYSECLYSYFIYPACKNSYAVLYCNLWPLWLYHIFPRYLINGKIFFKKIKVIELKMYGLVLSASFVRDISQSKRIRRDTLSSQMHIGLHVKYPLLSSGFNET